MALCIWAAEGIAVRQLFVVLREGPKRFCRFKPVDIEEKKT